MSFVAPRDGPAGLQRNALYLVRRDGDVGRADAESSAMTTTAYLDARGIAPNQ
jgi:hypothetical protein